jgi:trehalose 6-phosphate phosphatase
MRDTVQKLLEQIDRAERVFLLLDYDGTIVPIAPTPDLARPTPELLQTLHVLGSIDRLQLAVMSGRSLNDLERLLPLEGVFHAGNHGAEIRTPTGEKLWLVTPDGIEATLNQLEGELRTALAGLAGCVVENKGLSLALHYRLASATAAQEAIARFTQLGDSFVKHGAFEWLRGKKIIELRPASVNKGRAVQFLLERYARPGELPVYLGDDLTDEDAFRALKDSGITVLVSPEERPTMAQYRLDSPTDVRQFLKALGRSYGSSISVS